MFKYNVTWPCGSTWRFDRTDLDVPEFISGEQSGMTFNFRTITEALLTLTYYGCVITKEKQS